MAAPLHPLVRKDGDASDDRDHQVVPPLRVAGGSCRHDAHSLPCDSGPRMAGRPVAAITAYVPITLMASQAPQKVPEVGSFPRAEASPKTLPSEGVDVTYVSVTVRRLIASG